MIELNLYPWRPLLQLNQQRKLKQWILSGFVCALMLSVLIHYYFYMQIQHHERNLIHHKHKINTVKNRQSIANQEINLNNILKELNEQLKVHQLFQLLYLKFPLPICFSEVSRSANLLLIEGIASSIIDINHLIKKWTR